MLIQGKPHKNPSKWRNIGQNVKNKNLKDK